MLGGAPTDEDQPPNGPDDVQPTLFDFFGYGQPGQGPANDPPNGKQQDLNAEGWGLWPDAAQGAKNDAPVANAIPQTELNPLNV